MVTVPRFEKIPFLVHGFGDRASSAAAIRRAFPDLSFRSVGLRQVHSDTLRFVDRIPGTVLRGDAVATRTPGLLLIIKTADCLPVLLVDETRGAVAAVHCGWRGTLAGILEKTVRGMARRYGSEPGRLLAALGPCIGSGCYEVGEDVRGRFREAGFPARLFRARPGRPGKSLLDLAAANRLQLRRSGVTARNIFAVGICTHCDPRYPSYRRDSRAAGRMLSFIGLLPGDQNQRG